MSNQKKKPNCTHPRDDCFANKNGLCRILEDSDFGGKVCPFFKTREQGDAERHDCMEHLVQSGKSDMIDKYYGGKAYGCE